MHKKGLINSYWKDAHVARVVGMMHNDAVGEDKMSQRTMVARAPLFRRQLSDRLEAIATDQHAQMRANTFTRCLRVGKELADRSGVQSLDVVEFDERIDDQLPVRLTQHCILPEEMLVG